MNAPGFAREGLDFWRFAMPGIWPLPKLHLCRKWLPPVFVLPVFFMASASPGQAQQSPVCTQIKSELAALANGAGADQGREAQQIQRELGRVRLALQQNACNKQGFLFFNTQAPVCAPLKVQAGQYEARLRQIDSGPDGQRRAQLMAALERYNCLGTSTQQPPRGVIYATPQAPSLFDQLFNGRPGASVDERPPPDPALDAELEQKTRLGGRTAVCVRSCDGFFFPINFEGISARDDYEAVCRTLCPASDTQVFFMRLGGDIATAAARDGQPYSAIPNALRYRETRDEACFCKPPGTTWARAFNGVTDLVEARKGDILVTKEQAITMSRPKGLQGSDQKPDPRKKAGKAPLPPTEDEAQVPESALPTGGNASAGIGPKIRPDTVVAPTQGKVEDVIGPDGVKRHVRVVAPGLAVPEALPDLRGAKRP